MQVRACTLSEAFVHLAFRMAKPQSRDNLWLTRPSPHHLFVMPLHHRLFIALLLLGALSAPLVSAAHDEHDHDRARAAAQAGEILPLPTILDKVAKAYPGQVLEVELDHEEGRWIYEIKLLQSGGALLKLDVDAHIGEVLGRLKKERR